ncbi:hypothetical protein HAX54_049583 [Datura stramonium]|uniref:Calmodulin-binding domain-containing protein n=1 Tax=Datura stramonium TaxID=4076 RepID=A0ABS8SVX6_DATST|nr:hypothetical protein [Datura stramonium]
MVEDTTNLPVSSVTPVTKGSAGRKLDNISRGKPRFSTNEHRVVSYNRNAFMHSSNDGSVSRRLSTGTVEKGQDILPHYLRASPGSCHDVCKYGRKHSFEAELKDPLLRRTNKPPPAPRPLEGVDGRSRRNREVSFRKEKNMVPEASTKKSLKSPAGAFSHKTSLIKPLIIGATNSKNLTYAATLKKEYKIRKDGTNKLDSEKVNNVEPEQNLLEPAGDGNIMLSLQSSSPESLSQSYSPLLSNDEEKEVTEYAETEVHEALNIAEVETLIKSRKKTILSKGKAGASENNHPSVVNLKFKKGKVIDGNERCTIPNSRKVVLRHQDVLEKKDGQVLLNNVIEETATKLLESKKSKVKALVGAFESVISLQETIKL